MGTSVNTAILPSIPLFKRVINDTEENQRRVLNSYVKGMNRGTNTSPVQSLDEQQKPVITQADLQEETLQPKSPETEDTSMKQADPTCVQAQDMEEK